MEPQPRLWAWTSRISPRTADILIVLVLAIPGVIAVIVDPLVRGRGESVLTGAAGIGLVLLQSVPLFWRRRWPAAVLAIIAVAFALEPLIGANVGPAGLRMLVTTYSLAVYGSGSRRLLPVRSSSSARTPMPSPAHSEPPWRPGARKPRPSRQNRRCWYWPDMPWPSSP
jgi:hypothetical protein